MQVFHSINAIMCVVPPHPHPAEVLLSHSGVQHSDLKVILYICSERKSSCSVMCDSVTPWTVAYQAPPSMHFPGKGTGVGCRFLLQVIFPTQESNPGLPYCRQMPSLPSEPPGKPTLFTYSYYINVLF